MKFKNSPKVYKWILIINLVALISLVTFLVFNTFRLQNDSFQVLEKQSIVSAYGKYIMRDKLFPGGNEIFASYLEKELPGLVKISDEEQFETLKKRILDTFFHKLQTENHMDQLFQQILRENNIKSNLAYQITFDKLEIIKDKEGEWRSIYEEKAPHKGVEIAGKLQKLSNYNRAFQLAVNDDKGSDYRFTYGFYVDYPNRIVQVLKEMILVLLLSITCIVLIIIISYKTFQNWMNQRKEAQLKSDFLQHIRHEFNTPITTILVSASHLKELGSQPEEFSEMRDIGAIIERQAQRLKSYIKQIIESITIEDQRADLVEMDINELTELLLRDIRLRFNEQIDIVYEAYIFPKKVAVDALLYFSILDNLVENAFKFNPAAVRQIRFSWAENLSGDLELSIVDNGLGLGTADVEKIFEKFYRRKEHSSKVGLGLGLYYVHICAQKMNWSIKAKNNPQGGAHFILTIPIKK